MGDEDRLAYLGALSREEIGVATDEDKARIEAYERAEDERREAESSE